MKSLPISINLSPGFLDEEVRCDYRVTAKQKRIWAVQLDLLARLLDVCEKNDVKLQVFAGTLLGAIRHNGFIPWDDDIDVAMDRQNFEKLCRIGNSAFTYPYFFQTALTDRERFISEARLRNSLTTAVVKGQGGVNYNNGIYIDVFVLDGVVKNKFLIICQNILKVFLRKILIVYQMRVSSANRLRDKLLCLLRPLMHVLPYETYYRLYHKILSMYTNRSNYVGLVTHSNDFMQKYSIRKDELSSTVKHAFENVSVPIAENFDAVLRRMYGDYMKFPPPSSRGQWHAGEIDFDPDISYLDKFRNDTK